MKDFNAKGTGVALITPFDKQGNIDFVSLGRLINHVIEGGVDYLVCLGTTSEYTTLTEKEMIAVKQFTIETTDNRVPIVLGVGSNDTRSLVNHITKMDYQGISAVLSVAPYYNKPSQKGLLEHYRLVAESCPLPVIIYNVPGRTGTNISAETTLKLAEDCKNIIAVKEASGNMMQCMEILRQKPKGFELVSGEDALTLPLMSMGAKGVISVTANAMPKQVSEMVNLALKDSCRKATAIHNALLPLTSAIFEEGSPSGVKAALEILGICQNNVRLPLAKVSKTLSNRIQSIIKEIN